MKKKNDTVEEKLRSMRFRELSESESLNAWNNISADINRRGILSPLQTNRKPMIPLLIGALLFASVGGTAAASNSALPGDVLFPVDRALENARLAFAGNGKAELKLRFAEERLDEVDKLIAKARLQASATSTATTTATTTPERSKGRVAVGVNVAIEFLNDVAADLSASGNVEAASEINALVDRLETMVNDPNVKVALKKNGDFMLKVKSDASATSSATSTAATSGVIKVNTSGHKSRIEVREDGERFRIEIKDNGDIRIKTKSDLSATSSVNGDDDKDDRDEDNDDDNERRNKNEIRLNSGLKLEIR